MGLFRLTYVCLLVWGSIVFSVFMRQSSRSVVLFCQSLVGVVVDIHSINIWQS